MINLDKYAELLAKWSDKVTKKYEKELNSMYKELIKAALALLGSIFSNFEKDGKLTYTEMMKYKRLDSFHRQMNVLLNTMSKKQRDSLLDLLEEHYEYSWDWMAWAIENEVDIRLKNMKTKLNQVEKAMQNPINGLTLDETLEKNRREIITKVKRDVTQSLVQGNTYKQTADKLTKTFEGDYVKSVRVARTETHRVREQASLESAQEANSQGIIMVKRWMNMKDERVRRTPKANHVSLGGQSVPVDEPFDLGSGKKGQAPGMTGYAHHDINCRCLTGYNIERIEKQSQKDVAKRTFGEYRKSLEPTQKQELEVPADKQASNVIPNLNKAKFIDKKLTHYALDKNHISGGPKAVLFDDLLGYNQGNWEELKENVMANLPHSYASAKGNNGHGEAYESISYIQGPTGKFAYVLTGWIVNNGNNSPSLTTIYIIDEKKAKKKMEG